MRCLICSIAALFLGGCTEFISEQTPGRSVTEVTNESKVPIRLSVQAERIEPGQFDLQTLDIDPGDTYRVEFYDMHPTHPPRAWAWSKAAGDSTALKTELTLAPPRLTFQEAQQEAGHYNLALDERGVVWYTPTDAEGNPTGAPIGRELVHITPLALQITPEGPAVKAMVTNLTDKPLSVSHADLVSAVRSAELTGPAGEQSRLRLRESAGSLQDGETLVLTPGEQRPITLPTEWVMPEWLSKADIVELAIGRDIAYGNDRKDPLGQTRLEWSGTVPVSKPPERRAER